MCCSCVCVKSPRRFSSASASSSLVSSSDGSQPLCHQPLNASRCCLAWGLTAVTKWADVVLTVKRQSELKLAGYVAFE